MISFTMRGAGWGLLAAVLLAACGGGGGGGGGGDDSGTTYSLPSYTIAVQSGAAPVTNSDGSVRFYDHTHIGLAEAITGTKVKMIVTGIFNASKVYPVLFANTLGPGTDGWVVCFDRQSGLNKVLITPCVGEACLASRNTYLSSGTYNLSSEFSLAVEVDHSLPNDGVSVWIDTVASGTADDATATAVEPASYGTKMGLSLEQATIRSIQVVQQ